MAAWLRACRDIAPVKVRPADRPAHDGRFDGDDLVGVLANMAVAVLR
jgi:hypothetical protein